MITKFNRWTIEHDPVATAACYAQLPIGTGCDCDDCRNFDAAFPVIFTGEFQSFATTLGIDLRKPAELSHMCREKSGLHLTAGWYHLVGSIQSGIDYWQQDEHGTKRVNFQPFDEKLNLIFRSKATLVVEAFQQRPLVQLDFWTRVPWVLNEPDTLELCGE